MVYLYSSDQVLQSPGFEESALPGTFKKFPSENIEELNHLGSHGCSRFHQSPFVDFVPYHSSVRLQTSESLCKQCYTRFYLENLVKKKYSNIL